MKKLIHLSDLHFGTERSGIVDLLIDDIQQLSPDVIIVSGDLTQRALVQQFHSAKRFFNAIAKDNILCVPGNHDISLYNLIARFFFPFAKYKKFITPELYPQYCQNDIAILGVNSVTPFKPTGGFLTEHQLEFISNFFHHQSNCRIKILVMHHNLIHSERHKIISESEKIITTLAVCNVNLILSGHIHYAHIEQLENKYLSRNMYVVTAGTPTSTRTVVPNSFNIIELDETEFKLSIREFIEGKFITVREKIFKL